MRRRVRTHFPFCRCLFPTLNFAGMAKGHARPNATSSPVSFHCGYFFITDVKRSDAISRASHWRTGSGAFLSNQSGSAMRNWRTNGKMAMSARRGRLSPPKIGPPVQPRRKGRDKFHAFGAVGRRVRVFISRRVFVAVEMVFEIAVAHLNEVDAAIQTFL